MEFKWAVVIGRFQPFHNEHLKLVEHARGIADHTILIIGSAQAAPSIRNPFTFEERQKMVCDTLGVASPTMAAIRKQVYIKGVRDYYYNLNAWLAEVQAKTDELIKPGDSVALVGSYKDADSNWLTMFPQWEFVHSPPGKISGTDVRQIMFEQSVRPDWEGKPSEQPNNTELLKALVPEPVADTLLEWMLGPLFLDLCKEYAFTKSYRESWEVAPFPPVFVTADAVVTHAGHVLVVKRKLNPGKGLYALPGGFIRQDEHIEDGAIRELREETGIRIDKRMLRSLITDSHVFDYPARSLRGRTITHGFHFELSEGAELPAVRGGDDAAEALWMPLWDVMKNEDKFFEDHAHIIHHFAIGAQGER